MANDNGIPAVWTPQGIVTLDGKKLTRIEMRATMIEWFRQFSDVAAHYHLNLVCQDCGAGLTGRNSDSDAMFAVACGCREFVGKNRDYKSSPVN